MDGIVWKGLPIPPSVNELFENRMVQAGKKKKAMGRYGFSISRRKSASYDHYELLCKSWVNRNFGLVEQTKKYLQDAVKNGSFIYCDLIVAQHKSDFIAKNGNPKGVDSNNYVKAQVDILVKILGIDDKWFIGGSYEKVTCNEKESQCAIVTMKIQKIRSTSEIFQMKDSVVPGSQNSASEILLK